MNALDMAGLVFIRTATSPTVSSALILIRRDIWE